MVLEYLSAETVGAPGRHEREHLRLALRQRDGIAIRRAAGHSVRTNARPGVCRARSGDRTRSGGSGRNGCRGRRPTEAAPVGGTEPHEEEDEQGGDPADEDEPDHEVAEELEEAYQRDERLRGRPRGLPGALAPEVGDVVDGHVDRRVLDPSRERVQLTGELLDKFGISARHIVAKVKSVVG